MLTIRAQKKKTLIFLILFVPSILFAAEIRRNINETYFKNTPYELNVYKIIGRTPGKTMLVIGGIQGDEPTGYLAADHYVDIDLEQGSLIMVPRANFNTIIRDKRLDASDMNRRFTEVNRADNYEEKIVTILKELISEADILLNLHEGSGFFSDLYINELKNPKRYGQSIIADAAVFYRQDSTNIVRLKDIAEEVIEQVNSKIVEPEFHFHFNNHDTFSSKTIHAEQRTSATYYALSNFGIPAFGIESSKSITDIETKVRHQIWIINEFMKVFDIIPEFPRIYLEYPELQFVIFTVNANRSVIIPNKKTLYINQNDEIEIDHIEANYERGISADVENFGTVNDFRTKLIIDKPTRAIIKKDKFYCGEVNIDFKDNNPDSVANKYNYIVLEVNGNIEIYNDVNHIHLVRGDVIKIIDTVPSSKNEKGIHTNFYGFVHPDNSNNINDSNILIHTATDLLKQYSDNGEGNVYNIRIEKFNKIVGVFRIFFTEPEFNFVTIKSSDQIYNIKNGETAQFNINEIIEILSVDTNVKDKQSVRVNFKGFVGNGDGEDRNLQIGLNEGLLKKFAVNAQGTRFPVTVSHGSKILGNVYIEIINKM